MGWLSTLTCNHPRAWLALLTPELISFSKHPCLEITLSRYLKLLTFVSRVLSKMSFGCIGLTTIWHSLVKVFHCSLDWNVEEHSSIWDSVQHQLMPEVQNHQQKVFLEDCVEARHPVVQATKVKERAVNQYLICVLSPSVLRHITTVKGLTYHSIMEQLIQFHKFPQVSITS